MHAKIDRNRALVPLLCLAGIALFAGCEKNPLGPEGEGKQIRPQTTWQFVVEPAFADLAAGEVLQLRAYLRHPDGGPLYPAEVKWISENPKAAMVTEDGLVEAYASGPVTIRAALAAFHLSGEVDSEVAEAKLLVK